VCVWGGGGNSHLGHLHEFELHSTWQLVVEYSRHVWMGRGGGGYLSIVAEMEELIRFRPTCESRNRTICIQRNCFPCLSTCHSFMSHLAGVPYDLTPEFLEELFTKHNIDYVVHGDDPCLLPDGTDAYAHAKKQGRFRMVTSLASHVACLCLSRLNSDMSFKQACVPSPFEDQFGGSLWAGVISNVVTVCPSTEFRMGVLPRLVRGPDAAITGLGDWSGGFLYRSGGWG